MSALGHRSRGTISTQYLVAGVVVAGLCVALLAFVRSARRPAPAQAPGLASQVESLIGRWTLAKLPLNARVLNLVVLDSSAGSDLLDPPEEPASGNSLAASAFAAALSAQGPEVLTFTFDGFSKAGEAELAQDIALAVMKAHDSGAEINVVAQGRATPTVVKAVRTLEGVARGGVPVGVNKLITLGAGRERLKRIDPVTFPTVVRPTNVLEWARIYADRASVPAQTVIEFSSGSGPEASYDASRLFGVPAVAPSGAVAVPAAELAALVTRLLKAVEALVDLLKGLGLTKDETEEIKVRTFRALDGTMTTKVVGGGVISQAKSGQGSLGMVRGGGEYLAGAAGVPGIGTLQCGTPLDAGKFVECKTEADFLRCLKEACGGASLECRAGGMEFFLQSWQAGIRQVVESAECQRSLENWVHRVLQCEIKLGCPASVEKYNQCVPEANARFHTPFQVINSGGLMAVTLHERHCAGKGHLRSSRPSSRPVNPR